MSRQPCPFNAECPLAGQARSEWKYCPRCGTRAIELELPVEIDPAVDGSDGIYRMALTGADTSIEIAPRDPQSLVTFQGVERTPFGLFLKMDLSKLKDGEASHILISSDDERRQGLWETRSVRTRAIRLVHRAEKVSVVALPGVALFMGESLETTIDLENRGYSTVTIAPPDLPAGFELANPHDMAGFQIAPGEPHPFTVRRQFGATPKTLFLRTVTGTEVAALRLLPLPTPPPKMPPGLVVSIDFGTSNTSVFCLETRTGIVEPIGLMGDGRERRETLLYAPEGVDQRNWQAFVEHGVLARDVVRNLKKLVMQSAAGSTAQLEFFLQAILQNGIISYLEGRNPGNERTVEFVFTLPVLDGAEGPRHRDYRETLLACARLAGYEDKDKGWRVRTMLEPDGGSLEIISIPEISQKMTDGDRILIIDVGGGTTDVTMGRVKLSSPPQLLEVENVSVLANSDDFGGEIATYTLGWRWAKSDEEGMLPSGPERAQLGAANERQKVKILVDNGWLSDPSQTADAEGWKTFDEVECHPCKGNWERRFGNLWTHIRSAKHQFCDLSTKGWGPYVFDSKRRDPKLEWKVPVTLLDSALEKVVTDLTTGIVAFLEERNIPLTDVKHVAMIGGSARLQPLRIAMAKLFPSRLIPLGSYVDVAVCRGASRLYQAAPPILPIGFELVIGDDYCETLARPGASMAKIIRRSQAVKAPRGTRMDAWIRCLLPDGSTQPYLGISFENGFEGEIFASVSSGLIQLESKAVTGDARGYQVKLI